MEAAQIESFPSFMIEVDGARLSPMSGGNSLVCAEFESGANGRSLTRFRRLVEKALESTHTIQISIHCHDVLGALRPWHWHPKWGARGSGSSVSGWVCGEGDDFSSFGTCQGCALGALSPGTPAPAPSAPVLSLAGTVRSRRCEGDAPQGASPVSVYCGANVTRMV